VPSHETALYDFGLFIAFLLPGFTALLGASYLSPTVRLWIGTVPEQAPTLGGFLYTTIAAIAAGLTVSTLRWLLIDTLHHRTGLCPPKWDFGRLDQRVAAYEQLIAIHYHYYQAFGGMVIALVWLLIARHWQKGFGITSVDILDVGLLLLVLLFLIASRDALRLCGRPHKVNYVVTPVMWHPRERTCLASDDVWIGRHITVSAYKSCRNCMSPLSSLQ
jgi:hypothetical protein